MLSEKYQVTVQQLNSMFQKLDDELFGGNLQSDDRRSVVTIQAKGKHNAYGWCSSAPRWTDDAEMAFEINMSAEYLNRPLIETLGTLIHEMVHLDNIFMDIKDTSRKGVYHNKRFKSAAEAVGLEVTESEKHGYAHTNVTETLRERLGAMFGADKLDVPLGLERVGDLAQGLKVKTKKKMAHYFCPDCGQEFKTNKAGLSLTCNLCDTQMEEEEQ